tara:strand:+ start:5413 stop:5997 length:585 start_codon:yes stop_codon:yes gene_type:complete
MSSKGIVSIHGRDYWTVARRVADFRKAHRIEDGWAIQTEIISVNGEAVVVFARIVDPEARVVGTGIAEEFRAASKINRTSAIENAETSAIGRALSASGFAGSGEYASADEVKGAIDAGKAIAQDSIPKPKPPKNAREVFDFVQSKGIDFHKFRDAVWAAKSGASVYEMDKETLGKAMDWFEKQSAPASNKRAKK